MKILVIIPAYNEEKNIQFVVDRLVQGFPQYDYLVVNDGSTDHTEEICRSLGYNYLSQPVNLGIGGTVQSGYLYALQNGYDIAVQMDGDGQHDPRYIAQLIQPIQEEGADFTIGSRFIKDEGFQSSRSRRFGINFLSALLHICGKVKIRDVTSGFRAVNRKGISFYSQNYAQDYPEPEAIIAAAAQHFKIKEVPVVMQERNGGTSSISPLKSFYYMLKVSLVIFLYRITFADRG